MLMDEAFTSTSESDAVELAKSALIKLGNTGCKCVFTTHLHRLVADTEEINSKNAYRNKRLIICRLKWWKASVHIV